jgi:hypothetical protein
VTALLRRRRLEDFGRKWQDRRAFPANAGSPRVLMQAIAAGPLFPAQTGFDAETGWSLAASAGLHLVVMAAILLVALLRPPSLPTPTIPVEVVTPDEYEAATRRPDAITALPTPQSPPPAADTPAPRPGMVHATRMLSSRALDDPRSKGARQDLAQMSDQLRMEQLCGIEAMEQIHAWKRDLDPDQVVAFAGGEPKVAGTRLEADHAAFRSKRDWYAVSFDCTLSADLAAVTDFAFEVGATIPHARWAAMHLTGR